MAAPIPSQDLMDPVPPSTVNPPSSDSDSQLTITWASVPTKDIDATFATSSIDLIASDLGGRVLHVSDEWFAEARNLIKPEAPIKRPGVFDERGAW